MSAQASIPTTPTEKSATIRSAVRWRKAVDRSTDLSSTLFIVSGVVWLILGSLLMLISQFKLLSPEWLGGWRWLSYGRLQPMAQNALIYGWLSNVAMGAGVWLWARLTRTKMQGQPWLLAGGGLWNTGVGLGLIGIMTGFSRGVEMLEMPLVAFICLTGAACLFSLAFFQTMRNCQTTDFYVSGSFLGAAAIWLPILLATTLLPLLEGIAGAAYAGWFSHSLIYLWIVPVMLGLCYYLIPKIVNRAIVSYHLSTAAFWTYALFACWAGASQFVGSPVPFWLSSTSIGFSILLLVPASLISYNLLSTIKMAEKEKTSDPALRFIFFGVVSFLLFCLLQALSPMRWWNELTQYTLFQEAHRQLGLFAFGSMTAYGAVYYIIPRHTGRPWKNVRGIRLHFMLAAAGIGVSILAGWLGGVSQGTSMLDSSVTFAEALSGIWPGLQALGWLLALAGHALFASLLYGNIIQHQE